MATPILLPASFVGFGAERLLLAVADRLDIVGADATLHQRVLHGVRAAVAQSQVVLRRPALVAVSLDREVDVGMLLEESDICLQRTLLVRANIGSCRTRSRCPSRSARTALPRSDRALAEAVAVAASHGDSRRRLLRSTRSLGGQRVGGRIGRRHLLRAAGLHGSHAVDADVGGIAGLPGQRGRLSLVNGVGIGRERSRRRGWRRWRWWWRRCYFLLASAQEHDGTQARI